MMNFQMWLPSWILNWKANGRHRSSAVSQGNMPIHEECVEVEGGFVRTGLCRYLPYIKQHLRWADSPKCRASRIKLFKIYGESIQRVKFNQVYFKLRGFLPFAIHTHKVINKVKLDHLDLDCVMWDTQSNSVIKSRKKFCVVLTE